MLRNENKKLYKYPHNYENSFVKQKYMEINKNYYRPSNNRNENMIKEKLEKFWGKIYE